MQDNRDKSTLYQRIGGEEVIRNLVESFYRHMDEQEEVKPIRAMHAKSLKNAKEKLFMFLSGWMGGPELYAEKYGHPRLRMRHMPFAIDASARDQWMHCMKLALNDAVDDAALRDELMAAFYNIADFMRNRTHTDIVIAFLNGFCSGDIDALAGLLAPDLAFAGPLHTFDSAETYIDSLRSDPPIPADFKIISMNETDDLVSLLYDYIKPDSTIRIEQHFKIENGKISSTALHFDPADLKEHTQI